MNVSAREFMLSASYLLKGPLDKSFEGTNYQNVQRNTAQINWDQNLDNSVCLSVSYVLTQFQKSSGILSSTILLVFTLFRVQYLIMAHFIVAS